MNVRKFEDIVAAKKMRIERRIKHNDNEIYLCEGYCSGDRDCIRPHYKTMFALAHDPEHLTVGEFFTTEIVFPFMSKDDRLKSAELRAKEFANAMREVNAK